MRITPNENTVDDYDLELELRKLRVLKDEYRKLTERLESQTDLVYQFLTERGRKSWTADKHKYTIVQAERVKVNEDGLRKALGARLFNKLTVRKLDQKKLKDAITTNEVDPAVVSQYSEIALNRPSIRVTEAENE